MRPSGCCHRRYSSVHVLRRRYSRYKHSSWVTRRRSGPRSMNAFVSVRFMDESSILEISEFEINERRKCVAKCFPFRDWVKCGLSTHDYLARSNVAEADHFESFLFMSSFPPLFQFFFSRYTAVSVLPFCFFFTFLRRVFFFIVIYLVYVYHLITAGSLVD